MNTKPESLFHPRPLARSTALLLGLVGISIALPAAAGVCTNTANYAYRACGFDARDDELTGRAKCLHVADAAERDECKIDVAGERAEMDDTCDAQLAARIEICAQLGEARHVHDYSPELFDADLDNLTNPNPYYPLAVGHTWEYATEDEYNIVTVTSQTKRIEGLDCIVIRDKVFENNKIVENTDDWLCHAKNGDVHYLGEESKNYETFKGDRPRRAELVDVDGSFKSGREYDKGGILFLANPQVGDVYYEEFALGEAEDIAEILSTTYRFGDNVELDEFVPQALVDHFCGGGTCIVTRNTTPLEPGVSERKYYAQGIGFFLETKPDGEVLRLTDCNFDVRCSTIPQP